MYMCPDGIDGGSEVQGGFGGGLLSLMGEWRAGNDKEADWMLVHHSPFSWLQVVSHFPDRRISACLYMTARARQFACSTDNKRACACQNRWRCVTVSTQCCLLLAWPSTSRHVSFHNQGKGEDGARNHPAFLSCLFLLLPLWNKSYTNAISYALLPHFLLVCFVPSHRLSFCPSVSLSPRLCFGVNTLKFKEWLISVCLLFQDNISVLSKQR